MRNFTIRAEKQISSPHLVSLFFVGVCCLLHVDENNVRTKENSSSSQYYRSSYCVSGCFATMSIVESGVSEHCEVSSKEDMESDSLFEMLPQVESNNWEYSMRRDMQEVIPGLFIGPYCSATASKLESLQSAGITHIICVRCPMEARIVRPKFPDTFKYLVLDINDSPTENIIRYFPVVRDFVNESLRAGGKTLVHGNAGISRSAALVLAYVMEKYGISFKQAFNLLQSRRFCINPNEGFTQQLKEFEPIYHARLTVENRDSNANQCSRQKRRFDDVESAPEYMET